MSQLSQFNPEKPATHIASLGSESVTFNVEDFDSAVSALVKRQGGGVPKVEPLGDSPIHADVLRLASEVVSERAIEGSGGLGPIAIPRTLPSDAEREAEFSSAVAALGPIAIPETEPAPVLLDSTGTAKPDLGQELHARAAENFADREALLAMGHTPEQLDKTYYRRGIHASAAVPQA